MYTCIRYDGIFASITCHEQNSADQLLLPMTSIFELHVLVKPAFNSACHKSVTMTKQVTQTTASMLTALAET